MNAYETRRASGFTIVELLIVIVVIAILAAITIVAFNGVQTRANNNQTTVAVKEYITALHSYAIDNGDYPNTSGCLGEGYTTSLCLSQSGVAECFGLGGANASGMALNTPLRTYLGGKVPPPNMQAISCGATTYVGAYGWYSTATKQMFVWMLLKGDQTCPSMSPNVQATLKTAATDGTMCRYTLTAV